MKRDGGRNMNRLFRNILKENKNDYIRTVLGCSWIISLIYFSTAVGGCLSYISTGTIPQMTYLILEVEKEFLIPYGLLLFLLILLLSGYIRKRAAIYKTLTVFGMKRKHKYRFVLFEYLGIVGFSIILGIVLGICESKALKIILEYFFVNIKGDIRYGEAPLKLTLIISFLIFGLGFIVCDQIISCLGNQLEKKYGIEVKCIPDIRVTSGDYGEHTGISASEYQKLTGEKLKLHNHEIYVVYQRNKAEYGTLGIDYGKKEPRLYIGNSDADIWVYTMRVMPSNQFIRDYRIVGTTNRIITGNFKSRQLEESGIKGNVFEEIIVFSDEEYERISKTARGSDLTVAINIPQNYSRVVNDIYKYAEKNSQVNFFDYKYGNLIYEKKELIVEEQEANMLKVSAMIINIITLVICIIFTLYNNIASYKNKMRWKYTFFYRQGMDKMKIKSHLKREILLTTEIACISSIPFACIMVLIKILYKDLNTYWMIRYLGESLLVVVVLTIVIHFMVYGMASNVYKQIERSIQNEQ